MGDVVRLDIPVKDDVELDPDHVLTANVGKYQQVVLLGYDQNGEMAVCASHSSREVLWMMERAKHHLLEECE